MELFLANQQNLSAGLVKYLFVHQSICIIFSLVNISSFLQTLSLLLDEIELFATDNIDGILSDATTTTRVNGDQSPVERANAIEFASSSLSSDKLELLFVGFTAHSNDKFLAEMKSELTD